jgi:hypothetical protein
MKLAGIYREGMTLELKRSHLMTRMGPARNWRKDREQLQEYSYKPY